ncbi:Eukaryotic translation initiation factor 4E-binding protein Mextli [Araneus ventricosus]|uniref:Eukaryotic translation initiation factor 4E-binding protein Mextli n=1 Tax=Araneus ventricosus TaxID=182803 RepID=A0A4Y2MP79_ARAVE|nr:Eukaryotic translation initiation factor 4E-binding protein Mextli [Araneus ventricosus]
MFFAEILADLETLNVSISNWTFDEVTAMDISRMCSILKKRGEELDSFHKEAIDRYFCTLRNACRDERLDIVSRVKLLEVIELRAKNWKKNENLLNYFNMKIMELEQKSTNPLNLTGMTTPTIPYSVQNQNLNSPTGVHLGPGEILRSSGKFEKPTKIAGKNYFKDEIVIRNSDSGKVSPGARDRLVQITGPHEEAIGHAKLLVEDTIRRNASPVRQHENLSRQLSSENNSQRFDLRKQSSFKSSMNSFSSWKNNNFQRESISPSTSSDDDMGKDERMKNALDLSPHDFLTNPGEMRKQNSVSSESSVEYGKFIRSSSLPNESTSLTLESFPNVESLQNEDVFSPVMSPDSEPPPIPPPSYKRQTYSREFLLKCAKSHFSHNQPAEYARIHQNFREIICQSPVMFDPEKYEESRLQESTVCVLK